MSGSSTLQGSVSMTVDEPSEPSLFGRLMNGLKDFADDIWPDDFCLKCFAEGFLEGLGLGLLGLAALALIATLSAPLAAAIAVVMAVVGVAALLALAANWRNLSGPEKSRALGNLLGGLVAGKIGPKIPPAPIPGIAWGVTPNGQLIPMMVAVGEVGVAPAAGAGIGVAGGAVLMSGGGGGGSSSGGGEQPSRTQPTGEKGGKPTGKETKVRSGEENARSDRGENNAAKYLADKGYKVEQNPKVAGSKNPDYKVEDRIFDCYTPSNKKTPDGIADVISGKVGEGQADRIVVNMDDNPNSFESIRGAIDKQLATPDSSARNLKEVIGVRNGEIVHIFP